MVCLPLQAVLNSVTAAHGREVHWKASEGLVVQLQARAQGFLLRQRLGARLHFLNTQLPAIITIQVRFLRTIELQCRLTLQTQILFSELKGAQCVCLFPVPVEEVRTAESLQKEATVSLPELEGCGQGKVDQIISL